MSPKVVRSRSPRFHQTRAAWIHRALALLLVPLVLLAGSPPLLAADYDGRPIRAIEFKGTKTLSEETLLYYLGIKVGAPLDQEKLNSNIQQLWDRGLVDDLQIDATPEGDGVHLTLTIQERPVLRSIDYQGLKRLSRTDVQDKISSRHIRVHEGEPLSLGELQRIKSLIEELYGEKGYRFAHAEYKVQDLPNNEEKVVFTVDEGDRVRIGGIEFTGNHVFGEARLRWAMSKTKTTNLITRLLKKDVYNPATLQEDLDKVRDLYKGEGYKNITIGDPKIAVKALAPNAAKVSDQKRRMFITVPLDEGERFKFGQVSIDGNKVYATQILLRPFHDKTGSWLRAKVLDDGKKAVEELYHNTGYIFAQVEPELVERGDRVADVVLHVAEGEQYKVGRIEFEGNKSTRDKVLRRELRLEEGRVVSIGAVKNSITKINQLGYFKLNEEDPVKIDYDSQNKQVNLVFKGEESGRTQLELGGGWSQIDGFFGQFAISTKNFLGRGEQAGISIQTGAYRDLYDVSYYIPWWRDRPQSLGFRLYKQKLDYSLLTSQRYITNSKGAEITYGRPLGLFEQASITYALSKYQDTADLLTVDANGNPTGAVSSVQTTYIDSSSIRPAFVYDSRDNPFEPFRGQRLSLSTEYAGGFLRGNAYFIRPDVSYSLFKPVTQGTTKTVFALNLAGGLIIPFGGRDIPRLEQFYLGGENSLRGFRFRSIFATDPKTGLPLVDKDNLIRGGDRYLQTNVEYHFLLGGPFRLVTFVDAGQVYGREQAVDLSRLRTTAGLELRILVPVFGAPLRFIYSFDLHKKKNDDFEPFQFSIGTSF
jgi:outer membrane protein insertion porin family